MKSPRKYTCDGANVSPPLSWAGVPQDARTLALIVDDPDAPKGTFVHWVLLNLPTDQDGLPEDLNVEAPAGAEGANGFGNQGYGGPCPPPGDNAHHYRFRLYALDAKLDLSAGATERQVTQAMDGHVLAEAVLTGTYQRKQ